MTPLPVLDAPPPAGHDLDAPPCALPGTPLDRAKAGLDLCVHCGFCLPACPTYVNLEDENDSPRGRLVLMHGLVDGTLPPDDPDVRRHLDRCLGCRGCETACPSGVPYGHLLEAARATLAESQRPPLVARVILAVFARGWLLRPALLGARALRGTRLPALLARALPGRLGFALAMLASSAPAVRPAGRRGRRWRPRPDADRGTAALLDGCVMDGLYGHVHAASRRTLRHHGYRMVGARGQRCCGALHAHAGDLDTARALARANVAAFERAGADVIAVDSAGCGAMMKEYGHLLADDPAWAARAAAVGARVRDVTELLAAAGPRPAAGGVRAAGDAGGGALAVAYDAPCHLLHAQRVSLPPLRVLGAVAGARLVPLEDADQCCGAAGIYNLIEPDTSDAVLAPKLRHAAAAGARVVATGNPGCLMQIGAGLLRSGAAARTAHPVELLDAAYASAAAAPAASPGARRGAAGA
jgi:glycolate oxidase iron-sulfur subunit